MVKYFCLRAADGKKKDRIPKISQRYSGMATTPAYPRPSLVLEIFSCPETGIYRSGVGRNSIIYK
jgi:hypothetical protein